MSLTTETNSTKELLIVEKLNSIHEKMEEIYGLLSSASDPFVKGKMALMIETLRVFKRDFGV
jgi:hypothetical protein